MHRYSGNTVKGICGDEIGGCSVPLVKSDLLVEYIENYGGKSLVLKEEAIIDCKNKIEEYMK